MSTATIPFADARRIVRDHVIASIADAELAPVIFDIRANPLQNLPRHYSFAAPRTRNTGQYRDKTESRLAHVVQIGLAEVVKQSDHDGSLDTLLERVGEVLRVMGDKAGLSPLRAHYVDSVHALTPTREYLVALVNYEITADHHLAA